MTTTPIPARVTYPQATVVLHWVVAVLVLGQLVFGEAMSAAFDAMMSGEAEPGLAGRALVHGIMGSIIGLCMLLRLYMRLSRPIPPPAGDARWIQILSRTTHWLFYAILIGMPLAGLAAWFGGVEWLADAHSLAASALIALIVLHIAGALYHQFVQKDPDVLHRMLPGRTQPPR